MHVLIFFFHLTTQEISRWTTCCSSLQVFLDAMVLMDSREDFSWWFWCFSSKETTCSQAETVFWWIQLKMQFLIQSLHFSETISHLDMGTNYSTCLVSGSICYTYYESCRWHVFICMVSYISSLYVVLPPNMHQLLLLHVYFRNLHLLCFLLNLHDLGPNVPMKVHVRCSNL
jgi:hypothetical protein